MSDLRRGGRSGPDRGERGSVSVLVAVWALVLTMLAGAGMVLGSVLAARSRADAAADLGALAGAAAVLEGPERACARARAVVDANAATMESCALEGAAVRVRVTVAAPASVAWLLPGRGGPLRSRARAELVADDP